MSDIAKSLNDATTHDEIAAILHTEQDAAKTMREPRTKVEPVAEPTSFARSEIIGGREMTFEAPTELELEQMVTNAFKVASAVQESQASIVEAPKVDPDKSVFERTELELQFKRGEISAKDFLEKSGAISEYLANQGVPVEELKKTVETQRANAETQSWADAVEVFLHSPVGNDWRGGEKNKELLGLKLQALGLTEAQDKVAALAQAYASMKSSGMLFESNETESSSSQVKEYRGTQQVSRETQQTQQNPRRTTQQPVQRSSSLWGSSSGTSANDQREPAPQNGQVVQVRQDASPQELIAAWKANLIAQGRDPNAEFTQTFGKRK